jgi:hypothetical protein
LRIRSASVAVRILNPQFSILNPNAVDQELQR